MPIKFCPRKSLRTALKCLTFGYLKLIVRQIYTTYVSTVLYKVTYYLCYGQHTTDKKLSS